tara:strand:+ start:342 stop:476 length:135 start_codon:yes stop_codon:yes gene_type:complete
MSAKKYTGLEAELYDLFRRSDDFDEIGYYVGFRCSCEFIIWLKM